MEISNDDDAEISERMTGFRPSGRGDSPQIATRLDRWVTQGSVRGALALALLMTGLSALPRGAAKKFDSAARDRVPTARAIEGALQGHALESFGKDVAALLARFPEAKSLEDLYGRAGGPSPLEIDSLELEASALPAPGSPLEALRDRLAQQCPAVLSGLAWYRESDAGTRAAAAEQWSDLFLKYFFTGDLRRAGIHLVRRADTTSTYGLMASSLSEPESALWARSNQPFYLWMSDDGRSVAGSSESTAFLGGRSGDSPFAHRWTLANGEIAFLSGARLTIDHVTKGRVAEFDLNDPAAVFAHRRWLDLRNSRRVPPAADAGDSPTTRVRDDFNLIPKVEKAIAADFGKRSSDNAKTGRAFAELLLNRLLARETDDGGLDLVVVGTEKSFDEGKTFAELLEKISSLAGRRLRTETVYGADFTREDLIRMRDRGFSERTVVLGLASSGQTANTFYTLENLFEAWRAMTENARGDPAATPPHFLVSSHMDNPYTEELLGQGLGDGDPFKERNFVTFPAPLDPFHPAEAATVTHKAAERLLKEVALILARRLASQRGWAGSRLTSKTVSLFRRMVDNGDELNRRIVGLDEDGNPHLNSRGEPNDIPRQIQALGKKIEQALLENLWTAVATVLFVLGTLEFHATPASLLLGWFPNSTFAFSSGLPVLAGVFGAAAVGIGAWKTRLRWHPFLGLLGATVLASAGIFVGDLTVLVLDAAGSALGFRPWGSALGVLPLAVDASPVTLLNAASYVFFSAAFMLGLRKAQGRLLWDRFLGRVLVVVDPLHANARLSAARWRRMLNLRFGWMGLYSVNESSLGRMTHEEAPNTNVRGTLYLQNESRVSESATAMNFKQLGGSPNGPGRAWRMGIGHKPAGTANAAFTEGYVSLAMADDNPAGTDADLLTLQEYFQDAGARDTAGMALALNVAEGLANRRPLNFVIGQTSSEAKTSTTQQPHPPLPAGLVRDVFGVRTPPAPTPVQSARPRGGNGRNSRSGTPGAKVEPSTPVSDPKSAGETADRAGTTHVAPPPEAPGAGSVEARPPLWRRWASSAQRTLRRALRFAALGLLLAVFVTLPGSQNRWPDVHSAVPVPLRLSEHLSPPADIGGLLKRSEAGRVVSRYGGPVLLREAAGSRSKILTVIPAGLSVAVLAKEGRWARVQVGGVTGYVQSAYVVGGSGRALDAVPVRFSGSDAFIFPSIKSDRTKINASREGLQRASFYRDHRHWLLIETGGRLLWAPADQVRPALNPQGVAAKTGVEALLSEEPGPTDGFRLKIDDRGTKGGGTSSSLEGMGTALALLAAYSKTPHGPADSAVPRFMALLRQRGVSITHEVQTAVETLVPSLRPEAPRQPGGVAVINLLGGLKKGEFRESVLEILKTRTRVDGGPAILLVRNPQHLGAVRRQLRGLGLDPSHPALRFVSLTKLTENGLADPFSQEREASPRVVLSGVLERGLSALEFRQLDEVFLHTPVTDTTRWVSGGDKIKVLIVLLLAGTIVAAPLPQADDLRKALRVLQSA